MLFPVRFAAALLCVALSFSAFAVEAVETPYTWIFCRRYALQQLRKKNCSQTL